MANGWGILSWGQGNWNSQGDSSVQLTGQQLTSTLGNISYGWGILSWGQGNWGLQNYLTVSVTGQQLTGTVGTLDAYNLSGWGRLTWGSLTWGQGITDVKFTVTGLLATTALSSVNIGIGPNVPVTGQLLTLTEGSIASVKGNATARVIGDESLRLVSQLNDVTTKGTATVPLTGRQLTLTENSVVTKANANTSLTGQQLNTFEGSVSIKASTSDVYATGQTLNTQLGELDVGPDAGVSGEQVPVYLGNPTILGDANVPVADDLLTLSLDSVSIDLNTPADLTGQELTTSLNSVTASIPATVLVTGEQLLELELLPYLYTTLHDSMTTYDTSAFVNNLNVYNDIPSSGIVRFQDEYAFYMSKSIYEFDYDTFILEGLVRGVNGTIAADHPKESQVKIHTAAVVTADANISISGQQLTLTEGVVDSSPDAEVFGQQLTGTVGSLNIRLDTNVPVTGRQLTLTEGVADASPDANLTGLQLTSVIGNATVKIDVNVPVQQDPPIYISRIGNVTVELNTPVDITGELLTLSLNDVITRQSANVYVTGINLTTTTGQLYVTAWETINTGQTVNWTPVDTAA